MKILILLIVLITSNAFAICKSKPIKPAFPTWSAPIYSQAVGPNIHWVIRI